jgi:GTP cyclohydrolase N terminal
MDPLGHLAPWLFKDYIEKENVEIRPTIAVTRAHMKLPELQESVRAGRLVPDGKVCINDTGELAVTKIAVEPVWYLPGVAERFGIGKGDSPLTNSMGDTDHVMQMREHCGERSSKRRAAPILNLSPEVTLSSFCRLSAA